MGKELETTCFCELDFKQFNERLTAETNFVQKLERQGNISENGLTAGFELEAWLVDSSMQPAPENQDFLQQLNNPLVVPELSSFNVEINGDPQPLTNDGLSRLHEDLLQLWQLAKKQAEKMDLQLAIIGILPTVKDQDLCVGNMSSTKRYKAINEQIMKLRKGKPLRLDIEGRETLSTEHQDVMLEAGATSFQIHLKIPASKAVDYYNASKLTSAPLLAIAANSPYLFGKDLWAETRIPLFEQAVSVGHWDYEERVTFGVRYLERELSEVFVANRQRYPILIPQVSNRGVEKLDHLRLQNGSIWRWNRALIGWNNDGEIHYRIEQRVVPAGPTIIDSIANSAFYYGLVHYLANHEIKPHERAQFFTCRDNFYQAAKFGLTAKIRWDHKNEQLISDVISDIFLPMAKAGLHAMGINPNDIDRYLGIISARAKNGQNGCQWQRAYVAKHRPTMAELLSAYLKNQNTEIPVHEWTI